MKKLLLFSMLLATVAMTSCKKETAAPTLVGNWKIESVSITSSGNTEKVAGVAADFFNFKTDGTYEILFSKLSGTGTYKINGSKVTITTSGVDQFFDIQKLTATEATLYYSDATGSSKLEATYNLKK